LTGLIPTLKAFTLRTDSDMGGTATWMWLGRRIVCIERSYVRLTSLV